MASDPEFIEYACDQLGAAGTVSYRRMFGEAALYLEGKVIALVCDNQLFVKPTTAGHRFIGQPTEAPPYPGAKMHFLIEDRLDDRDWLAALIRATWTELPAPKLKKQKSETARPAAPRQPAATKTGKPRGTKKPG